MKVKELIEKLKKADRECEVYIDGITFCPKARSVIKTSKNDYVIISNDSQEKTN